MIVPFTPNFCYNVFLTNKTNGFFRYLAFIKACLAGITVSLNYK